MRLPRSRLPLYGLLLQSGLARLSDQMAAVVYGWGFLKETGSSAASSMIMASSLAALVGGTFFAGRLIQRFGARNVALSGGWLSVGAASAIAVLYAMDLGNPILIAVIAAIGAILDGPAGVASEVSYPQIARVARFDLVKLNAFDDGLDNVAGLIAPGTAALVLSAFSLLGAMSSLAILGFVAILILTFSMPNFRGSKNRGSKSIGPAIDFIWHDQIIFKLTILFSIAIALFLTIQLLLIPRAIILAGHEENVLAMVLFSAGSGGIAGALLASRIVNLMGIRYIVALAFFLLTMAAGLILGAASILLLCVSGALAGLASGIVSAPIATLYQTRPPLHLRADVQWITGALSLCAAPFAILGAGALADILPLNVLIVGTCASMALLSAITLWWVK
jgi:Major Facilitator Superfamily